MYRKEKFGGGVPARFLCTVDEFKNRCGQKFENAPHLDLNGKRPFQLNEDCVSEFIDEMGNGIGFIE